MPTKPRRKLNKKSASVVSLLSEKKKATEVAQGRATVPAPRKVRSGRRLPFRVARDTSHSFSVSSVDALTTWLPPMNRTYETALLWPPITDRGTCELYQV